MSNNYQCPKCGCLNYETDKMSAAGGFFSKKFVLIICADCGYTEMYKKESSTLENIGDFIFGS
jgi:hypothetical protein